MQHPFAGPRIVDHLRSSGKQSKLSSRFVVDVNVLDGTVMAPSTTFTKIWRLCNSGSLNWPRGSQLVWTDGAKFSRSVSVDIEVVKCLNFNASLCVFGFLDFGDCMSSFFFSFFPKIFFTPSLLSGSC